MIGPPQKMAWLALAIILAPGPSHATEIVVGSKKFTESVVLGEIVAQLLRSAGLEADHRRELGGTQILWNALLRGDIDIYPEYTGTLIREVLADETIRDKDELRNLLARRGISMTDPIGFNNIYALGMKKDVAARLAIHSISDLTRHADLVLGFSNEFMDRSDGWWGLRRVYNLAHRNVRGLDHDLAYRGIQSGDIHVTDLYSTDAEIQYYDLLLLQDDRRYFPDYQAVLLYRSQLAQTAPGAVPVLARLESAIDEPVMIAMNAGAKLGRLPESRVAADFVERHFGLRAAAVDETATRRLLRHTFEHLILVGVSLAAAILVAVPLGVLAHRRPWAGQVILAAVGIAQTIPSLALLVFMIPLLGIGGAPAVAALFLYSLLPILRNTHAGLRDIPSPIRESAEAIGLSPTAKLRLVELPLASSGILAGIKTAAVINVGTATLGAIIGAGGYGQPILTGIRLDDVGLILQGAVPAAVLAILVQGLFELLERFVVPRGLRLRPAA